MEIKIIENESFCIRNEFKYLESYFWFIQISGLKPEMARLNSIKLLLSPPLPVKPPLVVNMVAPRRWTPLDAHLKLVLKMVVDLVSPAPARWQKMITNEPVNIEPNSEELVPTSPLIIASWEVSHHVNPDLVML